MSSKEGPRQNKMSSRTPPKLIYRAPQRPSARGSWTTPKRMIWTGAFAAVTIVGTIYGAGLKTQQEYHAERKEVLEAPIEERIQTLETRRAHLVNQRRPLERKLEELRLRVQKEGDKAPPQQTTTTTDGRS
ncbi:hypothetical protein F4803DRAFT_546386 [Xylaria telfairii]|nr:hypothetical protein F4803DRAFT_546386 [Xylaria telfairii]